MIYCFKIYTSSIYEINGFFNNNLSWFQEMARVPHLEGLTAGNNCTSMAILWLLSLTLPPVYTKQPEPYRPDGASASSATKDPMWTSLLLLRKIASYLYSLI